jgi:hypothetical protein
MPHNNLFKERLKKHKLNYSIEDSQGLLQFNINFSFMKGIVYRMVSQEILRNLRIRYNIEALSKLKF